MFREDTVTVFSSLCFSALGPPPHLTPVIFTSQHKTTLCEEPSDAVHAGIGWHRWPWWYMMLLSGGADVSQLQGPPGVKQQETENPKTRLLTANQHQPLSELTDLGRRAARACVSITRSWTELSLQSQCGSRRPREPAPRTPSMNASLLPVLIRH
ncbi:hypothetical protein E1301_Tti020443 [Triplophysa tibetana]|uniref:Uncharacterized protein n=1 Tax=Triplophysa tibetana TaxID=1572043 RepID=A0A5A9PB54_9TELE|nr:hypothetical protein E1301_Tti020443 [Triplophysa tibetana]